MTDTSALSILLGAAGVALVHTAIGPDHYVPFVMLARVRSWSLRRTMIVTTLCGVGHVLSSILLGALGLGVGSAIGSIRSLESGRGDLAAWTLVALGGAYALWGLRRALRARRGLAVHEHDGQVHAHRHGDVMHGHSHEVRADTTFWALFVVFVLGPCEPLIPLFVVPASEGRWTLALMTAAVFGVVTVVTMLVLVGLAFTGLDRVRLGGLQRWSHALAGLVLLVTGLAVRFGGL